MSGLEKGHLRVRLLCYFVAKLQATKTLTLKQQCVCVLHFKPFFPPVDIQHNPCPCRFFNPREIQSYVVTKLRHRDTTLVRIQEAQ